MASANGQKYFRFDLLLVLNIKDFIESKRLFEINFFNFANLFSQTIKMLLAVKGKTLSVMKLMNRKLKLFFQDFLRYLQKIFTLV